MPYLLTQEFPPTLASSFSTDKTWCWEMPWQYGQNYKAWIQCPGSHSTSILSPCMG